MDFMKEITVKDMIQFRKFRIYYIKISTKIAKYLPSKVILTQNIEHVQRNFPSWRP